MSECQASLQGKQCSACSLAAPCTGGPAQHPPGPSHHLLHDDAGEALRHIHQLLHRKWQPPLCPASGKYMALQPSVHLQSTSVQSLGAQVPLSCLGLYSSLGSRIYSLGESSGPRPPLIYPLRPGRQRESPGDQLTLVTAHSLESACSSPSMETRVRARGTSGGSCVCSSTCSRCTSGW